MGYRYYFVKIPKSEVEKVRDMSVEQLFTYGIESCLNDYNLFSNKDSAEEFLNHLFYNDRFLHRKDMYDLGKMYWDDSAEKIHGHHELFNDPKVREIFADNEMYVVGKEGLIRAIEVYKQKIVDYYKNLLVDDFTFKKRTSAQKIQEHLEDVLEELRFKDFLDLDPNTKNILTWSWKYEYEIFNLVHILKIMDWEKDTLLMIGR